MLQIFAEFSTRISLTSLWTTNFCLHMKYPRWCNIQMYEYNEVFSHPQRNLLRMFIILQLVSPSRLVIIRPLYSCSCTVAWWSTLEIETSCQIINIYKRVGCVWLNTLLYIKFLRYVKYSTSIGGGGGGGSNGDDGDSNCSHPPCSVRIFLSYRN